MIVKVDQNDTANLSNTASFTSNTTDPTPGDHSATELTPADDATRLDLVTGVQTCALPICNNLTYTITVSNAGPSVARSVQVTDPVPANTSFVSAEIGRASCRERV